MIDEYLTTHEVARYLNCKIRHVRHLIRNGSLTAYRLGGRQRMLRIKRADADKVMILVEPRSG